MKQKIFLFDLDGSLALEDQKHDTHPENKIYIQKLKDEGHIVGVCTGRPFWTMNEILENTKIEPFITSGGALVKIGDHTHCQDIDVSGALIFLTKYFPNVDSFEVYNQASVFKYKPSLPEKPDFERAMQISFFLQGSENLEKVEELSYGDYEYQLYYWPHNEGFFIEIHNKNASKATGIKYLLNKLGKSIEDVVFLGDSLNDLSAMKIIEETFAPSNSAEEIKAIAKYNLKETNNEPLVKIMYQTYINKL